MPNSPRTHDLFQVVSIVKVSRPGAAPTKKVVRDALSATHASWHAGQEVLLVPCSAESAGALALGRAIPIPTAILSRLGTPERVAFVQRDPGLALKRFELVVEPGIRACIVDVEQGDLLKRVVHQNAPPEIVLRDMVTWAQGKQLSASLRDAVAALDSFEGWMTRRLLRWDAPGDEDLRVALVRERLAAQREDGSWDGQVNLSARRLCELDDLAAEERQALDRGLAWLLARPESPHNPGMIFCYDDLVSLQMDVVAKRETGNRARFRERRAQEMRLASSYDELYFKPCGPRIMWPNAHTLDAALRLGYEGHPRVRRMLDTLATQEWCECAYQHGATAWKRTMPMDDQDVETFVASCQSEYAHGGLADVSDLNRMDLSWTLGQPLLRVSREAAQDCCRYALARPVHLQGCEMVTTRALAHAADARLRKLAIAHLWRFAGRQNPETGAFGGRSMDGYFHSPLAMLDVLSRFDEPIALATMARALPNVVASQRQDGFWGEGTWAPALTLVIARTLAKLKPHLPPEFIH